jgi:phosphatidylinositol-binding clathrin assembly protein
MDLLELFKVMNEGTINVLEHYFEMSRPDAERALTIYKTFGRQTEQVVQYLGIARQYETSTRLEVPRLKHAPTTLTSSLEDYLNDPDFELHRRQYLAQQEAKRSGRAIPTQQASKNPDEKTSRNSAFPTATTSSEKAPAVSTQPAKGPPPDLIDFFESIDSNQQPMAQQGSAGGGYTPSFQQQQFQPQQAGYNPFMQQQQTSVPVPQHYQQQPGQPQHFQQHPEQPQQFPQQQMQPIQTAFTVAGFGGGYTAQPNGGQAHTYTVQSPMSSIPQNGIDNFTHPTQPLQPQQTSTNPFRQSTMPTSFSASSLSPATQTPNRQSTNPFAKGPAQPQFTSAPPAPTDFFGSSAFGSQPQSQQQDFQTNSALFTGAASPPQQATPIQPQRTGTNPFATNRSPPPAATPLAVNPTGSTNPFRQSAFVNQQTGLGWQRSDQLLFGDVQTVPVFPRPGQN